MLGESNPNSTFCQYRYSPVTHCTGLGTIEVERLVLHEESDFEVLRSVSRLGFLRYWIETLRGLPPEQVTGLNSSRDFATEVMMWRNGFAMPKRLSACMFWMFALIASLGLGLDGRCDDQVASQVSDGLTYDEVNLAFGRSHDGWSVDEVLLCDERRRAFVFACQELNSAVAADACYESLLRTRKAGKITHRAEKRRRDSAELEIPVAEIAARRMQDQYDANLDQILASDELLSKFDEFARDIDHDLDVYLVRKAALKLRKARRLRPELVARVADWKREIIEWSLTDLLSNLDQIPDRPGVYLFRDPTGYLYIGQSNRLNERMRSHLEESDRVALADYLASHANRDQIVVEFHVFGDGSPAQEKVIREAYESDLIRTRNPKLNLKP